MLVNAAHGNLTGRLLAVANKPQQAYDSITQWPDSLHPVVDIAGPSLKTLAQPVSGTVEKVGLKVGRMDVLGMDPVAEADARVIEVDILLDDVDAVKALTNLQVEVEITP